MLSRAEKLNGTRSLTTQADHSTKTVPKRSPSIPDRELPALYKCPARLVILLGAFIFLAETLVMFALALVPPLPLAWGAFIDASALVLVLFPPLYFLLFRPFRRHLEMHRQDEEDIRQLSRKLLSAAEEERRRLALDLHDELGQGLTALHLQMEALRGALPEGNMDLPSRCDRIIGQVRQLGDQVRATASNLRPSILDDLGIVAALQALVSDLLQANPQRGIELRALGLNRRLPPETETALYRVCQEGISNALRHGEASRISIHLTASHPRVILTIQDNGKGFDPRRPYTKKDEARPGLGLIGMRERVGAAGGFFRITSTPGRGTTLRAEFPMNGGDSDG